MANQKLSITIRGAQGAGKSVFANWLRSNIANEAIFAGKTVGLFDEGEELPEGWPDISIICIQDQELYKKRKAP